MQKLDMLGPLAQDEIVGYALVIVEEVFLDLIAFVTEAEDEVRVPIVGVVLHHMPDDRPVAEWHERFRDTLRVVPQAGAKPAAKKHDLHRALCHEMMSRHIQAA